MQQKEKQSRAHGAILRFRKFICVNMLWKDCSHSLQRKVHIWHMRGLILCLLNWQCSS